MSQPMPESQMCTPHTLVLTDYVEGMQDSDFQSIFRSVNHGAAAQYIIYSQSDLDNTGIDQAKLGEDINYFVSHTGDYFKTRQDLKGSLYVLLMLYPGYKGAYQYPLEQAAPESKKDLVELNRMIKDNSQCNKEGFCTLFTLADISYTSGSPKKNKFNKQDYYKYIKDKNKITWQHYPTQSVDLEPIVIILVISTNGQNNEPEAVERYLRQKLQK